MVKEFFKKWLWLIVLVGVLAVGAGAYCLFGYLSEVSFDRTIQNKRKESNTAVDEAQNANVNASIFAGERQLEDGLREKAIAPKLDERRRNSQNSKSDLERSKKKYFDEQKNTQNLNSNHAANCASLARLFPNVRFEDCQ
ncbi:MAG TPA: hypothetical protein VF599_12565 [Pyrinomonadaceae bacterium]|jgi:hypothetical protein